MKARFRGVERDLSYAALSQDAGAARIEFVDVADASRLEPDATHASALVVFTQSGVPISSAMVDLAASAESLRERVDSAGSSLVTTSHIRNLFDVSEAELPRISVVIPSIVSRLEDLAISLDSVRDLDYPDYEVVLVDNRRQIPRDDPLPGLVEGREWVRVVREPRPGISAARNAGIAHSNGDVIAFTDDDVRTDRRWLRALGARFALNDNLGAVTGLILPAELESPAQVWFERYYGGFGGERSFEALTLEPASSKHSILRGARVLARDSAGSHAKRFAIYGVGAYAAGANMAFRRSALEKIDYFDVALGAGTPSRGGEDLAALISVLWSGGSVGYEPAAFVHHRHRQEFDDLVFQLDGYGVGFTAMITSLVWHDKRHLLSIAAQVPLVVFRLSASVAARVAGSKRFTKGTGSATYPRALMRSELRAYPRGPLAYLRSRKSWRDASYDHKS
jgi:glycosyltransferase involved in cell wall biosynthesis